ncbi:MAG: DeoR/GlpR family DNA-binding transcription regulator [Nocardioidaceae bacterium]
MTAEPASSGATQRRATRVRHDALVVLLREGVDSVETLAERVGVSASTVRRDLSTLQREGRIARTYGGAMVREGFHERSFSESSLIDRQAKAAIAATAADMVPDGTTVFLDAGTTCLALARLLADRGSLKVATRGLEAAALLTRAPGVDVVLVGGQVQPLSHGVVGPLAAMVLDRLSFDVAFLGADAVDPAKGLGEPTTEETYVKEKAAERATEVVLLADASKLGPAPVSAWIPLDPAWTLVTDSAAAAETVAAFEQRGVRVLTAG